MGIRLRLKVKFGEFLLKLCLKYVVMYKLKILNNGIFFFLVLIFDMWDNIYFIYGINLKKNVICLIYI